MMSVIDESNLHTYLESIEKKTCHIYTIYDTWIVTPAGKDFEPEMKIMFNKWQPEL